jgi:hypothetical protein
VVPGAIWVSRMNPCIRCIDFEMVAYQSFTCLGFLDTYLAKSDDGV